MSASLVGSEMCIRDSLQAGHAENDRCLYATGVGELKEALGVCCEELHRCLLYTSDAADDM
eukprot:8346370-Alexandrium_andersonii.AAC.1